MWKVFRFVGLQIYLYLCGMKQLHVFSPCYLCPIGAVDHQHGLDTCRSFRLRFTLLFLAVSVFSGPACAQNSVEEDVDLEQLYQEIDDAIEHSANYVTLKENNIADRRKDFLRASDANEQLVLAEQLFWLYKPYKNDSQEKHKLLEQRVFRHFPSQGAGTEHVALTIVEFRDHEAYLATHVAEHVILK